MARVRRARVHGPYREQMRTGERWKLVVVRPDGERTTFEFPSKRKAEAAKRQIQAELPAEMTVGLALERYRTFLLEKKGNKRSSVNNTMGRLQGWMSEHAVPLRELTFPVMSQIYERRTHEVEVATHQGELGEVKTFFRWCVKKMRWLRASPAEEIEPVGKKNRRKPQLRRGECRQFLRTVLPLAEAGDDGAVGVLLALVHNLRSGEIRCRRVRDVDADQDSVLLWIDEGKSVAASRHLELAEPIDQFVAKLARGRGPDGWLFTSERSRSGHREKTWLLRNTKRLCKLAGVPVRTTHGLRGTWSTLTTEAGVSGHIIMREMGHESQRTTRDHYIAPGAEERARTRKFLTVLAGGAAAAAPEKGEGEPGARGNSKEPQKFPREMDRKKAL